MKLKHPVVLSLTSICHCNLGREKGRETDVKERQREKDASEEVRGDLS